MVCPDAELAGRLRAACAELGINGVTHLAQYPRIGALASALMEHQANLCFIDVAAHAEFALLLIGEASASAPVVGRLAAASPGMTPVSMLSAFIIVFSASRTSAAEA